MKKCPKCAKPMIGVEYDYGHKHRYDGVSEYACAEGHYRVGRWCGQELKTGEVEPKFCQGQKQHPRYFNIND